MGSGSILSVIRGLLKDLFSKNAIKQPGLNTCLLNTRNSEFLLNREILSNSNKSFICDYLTNKKILITGAVGSIGGELYMHLLENYSCNVLGIDFNEEKVSDYDASVKTLGKGELMVGDLNDEIFLNCVFAKFKPDIIFHCAAFKHVHLVEQAPYQAFFNNTILTGKILDCAIKYDSTKFVLLSTDKAADPTSVLGLSKALAEKLVESMSFDGKISSTIVRFGNVLNSSGSVLRLFKKQYEDKRQIQITHKAVTRYFISIEEVLEILSIAAASKKNLGMYTYEMGLPIKILDLAKRYLELMGEPKTKIVFTGLRAGESINETLTGVGENLKQTEIPNILEIDRKICKKSILWEHILECQAHPGLLEPEIFREQLVKLLKIANEENPEFDLRYT